MDWSKAKSILIVALIVTNMLLGYVLFLDQNNVDTTVDDKFVTETIDILNDKNITLNAEIPLTNSNLFGLTVEYELLDSNILNNNFFDGKGQIDSKGEGLLEISLGDEIITVVNKKLIIYELSSNEAIYDIKSEEQAIDIAKNFLESKQFILSDMKLSFIKKVDGVYNIEFTKIYGENYIEATFTNLQIDKSGVKKLERNWLNMKEVGTNLIQVSSAPKSILALISMEEVYGKTITDISLCYYFDPEKQDYIQDPGEAQQGSTIPAWRIQFEDGYKVFIDNY